MKQINLAYFLLWLAYLLLSTPSSAQTNAAERVRTGAESMSQYLPMLEGKRVGLVVNQTAVVQRPSDGAYIPLPDTLLNRGVDVRCIMAPEHGYKGSAEAGAHITDG